MTLDRKRQLIGLLILIGLLMVILATSLPSLRMRLGMNLYAQRADENVDVDSVGQEPDYSSWDTFILVFSNIVKILLLIYIVGNLFTKEGRKRLLGSVGVLIILALTMLVFSNVFTPFEIEEEMAPSLIDEGEPEEVEEDVGTPVDFDPEPQPWLLTVVIVIGAISLAGIVFFILTRFSNQNALNPSQFDEIAEKARSALEEIEAADFKFDDIIIRCYAEMSYVLQTQNGIKRPSGMTTFEFEQELIKTGFPARPVQQLTRLFEQVRYGRQDSGEKEKQMAVESLGEIIDFCRVSA